MEESHSHSKPESVCGGIVQSAEDEIAAAELYAQTAEIMEDCATNDRSRGCPSDLTDREVLERAEEIRKIDEEERTHGIQFVEMMEEFDCSTPRRRRDIKTQIQEL